jgi:hypothetical protein
MATALGVTERLVGNVQPAHLLKIAGGGDVGVIEAG